MPVQFTAFIQDTAERCARTFFTTYSATWVALKGTNLDTLLSVNNLKTAVAGSVLTLFICLGVKQAGGRNSAGITNTDPKPEA